MRVRARVAGATPAGTPPEVTPMLFHRTTLLGYGRLVLIALLAAKVILVLAAGAAAACSGGPPFPR